MKTKTTTPDTVRVLTPQDRLQAGDEQHHTSGPEPFWSPVAAVFLGQHPSKTGPAYRRPAKARKKADVTSQP